MMVCKSDFIRNVALADVQQRVRAIEAGRECETAFTLCYGPDPMGDLPSRPPQVRAFLFVGRFDSDTEGQASGWVAEYSGGSEGGFELAIDLRADASVIHGRCAFGPWTVPANCVVPVELILKAIEGVCTFRDILRNY